MNLSNINELSNGLIVGDKWKDFHATITISLGELLYGGWDWGKNEYFPEFTQVNRTRLNKKIEDHYYFREICQTPPGRFKKFLVRKLNEVLPKYNEIYKLIAAGRFDLLRIQTTNSKGRSIYSEYPQTQIQGNGDYATNANDNAGTTLNDGASVGMIVDYAKYYNDIDVMILNEINVCFLSLLSLNVNV